MKIKELNIRRKSMWGAMLVTLFTLHSTLFTLTSCVETDSTLVEYVEDNKLNSPNDTVYSFVGILNKLQKIADRSVLLGEIRADLTTLTDAASLELQDLANFDIKPGNQYNNIRDYYAVIQNCNYYIANADTMLKKRGEKVFERELAAIRSYRAWTYMQLAMNYGKVPFFTKPILAEKDADPSLYPHYGVEQMADTLVRDLTPYVDVRYPSYNGMGTNIYYPVRVIMGDLCLWAGRYKEAAGYYHDWLCKQEDEHTTGITSISWHDRDFLNCGNSFNVTGSSETVATIRMAGKKSEGLISFLPDIFTSTDENNYFYQATRSRGYGEISAAQTYCNVQDNPLTGLPDTIYIAPDFVYPDEAMRGDLRLYGTYSLTSHGTSNTQLNSYRQDMRKHQSYSSVTTLRVTHVYLRYAEALNRAGFPDAAFAVLKYGMCQDNLIRSIKGQTVDLISPKTRQEAGNLIQFNNSIFDRSNTQGVHARGCGNVDADTTYCIPSLATLNDSVLYVEDLICTEMALETAGEGKRFHDLIRFAKRRNDPSYLAGKVALRNGAANYDAALYSKLLDEKNWYLPIER